MKLIQLTTVLALAGAVTIGCNSGPAITGAPPPVTGGTNGGGGTGGGTGGTDGDATVGECINEDDAAVYAEVDYTNDRGEMTSGTDAVSAIGSDCVRGSDSSIPQVGGCGSETIQVVACFPNCPEATITTLAVCVEECIQGTIDTITGGGQLSDECIACYGATVACGAAFCTDRCAIDTTAPDCIDCRCTLGGDGLGCTPEFVECSGIPSDDC